MGTERSGRRKIESPDGLKFPPIGTSEESIRRYFAAVAKYLGTGELDPRVADSMTAAAKGALTAIRDRAKRLELEELEKLAKRAEAVSAAGEAFESKDRGSDAVRAAHRAGSTDPGTTPATEPAN